jgi:hypothetical protein
MNPNPRIAAVMHEIVHQSGMAADGDAVVGGTEIGFRSDRVLLLAHEIAHIGQ